MDVIFFFLEGELGEMYLFLRDYYLRFYQNIPGNYFKKFVALCLFCIEVLIQGILLILKLLTNKAALVPLEGLCRELPDTNANARKFVALALRGLVHSVSFAHRFPSWPKQTSFPSELKRITAAIALVLDDCSGRRDLVSW